MRAVLHKGQGVKQDYDKAAQWFRKAADQGDALRNGTSANSMKTAPESSKITKRRNSGTERRPTKATRPHSIRLGHLYDKGLGVNRDAARRPQWYRKAADQGTCRCPVRPGHLYLQGAPGFPKNSPKAFAWYKKAADQGNAEGQNGLGLLYANGWGVAQDYDEARLWYDKAAEQGNAEAQSNLGDLYYYGYGVQPNPAKAASWYLKAGDKNSPAAMFNLATLYRDGIRRGAGITPRPPSGSAKRPTKVMPRRNISLGSSTRREKESRKTRKRRASGSPRPPAKETPRH